MNLYIISPGFAIKLKRNEYYYGENPPIKEIIWLMISGYGFNNLLKMKNKELDFTSLSSRRVQRRDFKRRV